MRDFPTLFYQVVAGYLQLFAKDFPPPFYQMVGGYLQLFELFAKDFPTPFYQMVAGYLQLFARGFSRESDELLMYLHLAPLIQE